MEYSRSTVGTLQLDQYAAIVPLIYGKHDAMRSIWDIWCHASHHAAAIAEEIRKGADVNAILAEIADFFLWVLTAINKLYGDLGKQRSSETPQEAVIRISSKTSDLLWNKYPGICPSCFWYKTHKGTRFPEDLLGPCDCQTRQGNRLSSNQRRHDTRLRAKALREFAIKMAGHKPISIDGWQAMFGRVFRPSLSNLTLVEVVLHLLEEVGEVANALIRMYSYTTKDLVAGELLQRQIRLEDEFADTLSWLFALVEKLGMMNENIQETAVQQRNEDRLLLSRILWEKYGSDELRSFYCRHCNKIVCDCPIVLISSAPLVTELLEKTSLEPE